MKESYGETYRPAGEGKVPGPGRGIEVRPTICSICNPNSHCGLDAYVKDGRIIKLEGSLEAHNAGALCAKGAAGRQYVYHPDRLLTPLIRTGERGSGRFEPASWEEALALVSRRLRGIKAESGPETVVFYAGYPKWMRPFLKRLAHSFGSPNYATESSTCYTAARLAALLNYGDEPDPDVGPAKCLLVWSRNPFYSNPPRSRGLLEAREKGLKIIEVGPLLTPLTRHADLHLRLRPGTSGALALGMAHVIIEEGLYDRDFVARWTVGFEEFRAYTRGFTPQAAQEITGVPAELIVRAARLYAGEKPAALMSGACPTVHHTNGVQNQRAVSALIGLTGNYDVPGGNHVFPSDYLYVSNGVRTRVEEYEQSRPWSEMAPRVGQAEHPVWCRFIPEAQSMVLPFQIHSRRPYPLRAMLAFGLNHRMWPGSDFLRQSLERLDFLAVVDLFMTDTARKADVILPACSSFERSELKFYPGAKVLWTSPVIAPLGESKSDADIIFDLARTLAPEDELLELGYEASVDWILEPSGLKVAELKKHPRGLRVENVSIPPYRKYETLGFSTPSGKMEFTSKILAEHGLDPLPVYREPGLSPVSTPDTAAKFPLVLTTGARLPMFIHSRTYRLPWLRSLRPDPLADLNPADARARGIGQDDWVLLSTPRGEIRVRANLTEAVPVGVVNMYHAHPEADVNTLIPPDYRDPLSGFPGFKSLLAQVEKAPEGEEGGHG
ncbi:MAG: molybdopterin-dependent oxidoreductase [Thermodesulfobacteriota bacterium]